MPIFRVNAWGAPTVWMGLLGHKREAGTSFSSLKHTLIGGSALPRARIGEFKQKHGVETIQDNALPHDGKSQDELLRF